MEPDTKPEPDTARSKAGAPADTDAGVSELITGGGAVTVKTAAADVTGPGFTTVIFTEPGAATRFAGTAAVSCVALPKVVVSAAPPHCTVEPDTKLVPVTVSVNAAPPATAEEGDSEEIVGAGAAPMVNEKGADGTGPGFTTVIFTEPGAATRFAGTAAVS